MNDDRQYRAAANALLARLEGMGVVPTGVADDSRQVRPGDVFVAYPGDLSDGRHYIQNAIDRGAVAVVWAPEGFVWPANLTLPNFPESGLRSKVGWLAHRVAGQPSEQMPIIAVTGTNGKTTISQWLSVAHPKRCASIGTLGAGFAGAVETTGFTTPEAATLVRWLVDLRQQGAQACALEASSIGIEEGRMNGLHVDTAIFTNFTRDHLDYHGSMEAYAAAKARLFEWPRLRFAVINLDDPMGQALMRQTTAAKVVGYTLSPERVDYQAVIRAEHIEDTATGQRCLLVTPQGRVPVNTCLIGRYNLSNLLAVAAVLLDAGVTLQDLPKMLAALKPPPGRMEVYGGTDVPLVLVDYAHTPDALENALQALRPVAQARGGKLTVLFGCGGDRDPGKRPMMGAVAARLADQVCLTSDNPRSEDPAAILAAIQPGCPAAQVVPDRGAAIQQVIENAAPADVILLAGKGHEPYQEVAGVRYPFHDGSQAQQALSRYPSKQAESEQTP